LSVPLLESLDATPPTDPLGPSIRLDPQPAYPRFFLWLILLRRGDIAGADQGLANYLSSRKSEASDWTTKIGDFLLDRIKENDLLAAAASSDAKRSRGQNCEAWYYAATKQLVTGNKGTASDYFKNCLATGATDFVEHFLAKTELKRLETE
jgi:lipoprotein NlpI